MLRPLQTSAFHLLPLIAAHRRRTNAERERACDAVGFVVPCGFCRLPNNTLTLIEISVATALTRQYIWRETSNLRDPRHQNLLGGAEC